MGQALENNLYDGSQVDFDQLLETNRELSSRNAVLESLNSFLESQKSELEFRNSEMEARLNQMQFSDDRSGTWVILSDNENNVNYFVCNSHWTTVSSAERLSTAQKIVEIIKNNSQGLPLIVLGDFNAVPGTPEISSIKNSGGLSLNCAHNEKGETFHGWDATGEKKIDWILCSKKLSVKSSSVITTSYGGYWPSDHWPVKATFIPAS